VTAELPQPSDNVERRGADRTLTVLDPGPLTTVQDLGRPGLGHLGVGTSGAADRRSFRLANRLVGNDENAAGLEMTLGGLKVRFDHAAVVSVAGAACELRLTHGAPAMYGPFQVRAGDELVVGTPGTDLRSYLAVRGGIMVAAVLGARSTDLLAGLGPPGLAPGMVLPIGTPTGEAPLVDLAPQPGYRAVPTLTIVDGPRGDWFTPDAHQALCAAVWSVSADANRVGVRLSGPALTRRILGELPPEPMTSGALQVPPDGNPILFLAEHPVTGGYPVIAVVAERDLHLAAQLRPGQQLRFRR
jgi:biotin-dependent carboxylase-like uncharacterized protein